jgi:hypothetical protein
MVLGGTINGAPATLGYWANRLFRGTVSGALPPRSGHVMQWDETHQQVLIFGGRGADGGVLADTWAWAEDGGFIELSSGPPARWGAALGWDERERRMVLAGGVLADGTLATDTWVHDGRAWAALDAGPYQPRVEPWLNVSQVPTIMLLSGGLSLDGGSARTVDGGLLRPEVLVDGRWGQTPERALWGGGRRPAMGWHPELGLMALSGAQVDEICGEYDCENFLRMESARLWRWSDWGWYPFSGEDAGAPLNTEGTLSWSRSRGELILHQGRTFVGPGAELANTLVLHPWHLQYRWSTSSTQAPPTCRRPSPGSMRRPTASSFMAVSCAMAGRRVRPGSSSPAGPGLGSKMARCGRSRTSTPASPRPPSPGSPSSRPRRVRGASTGGGRAFPQPPRGR